MSDKSKYDDEKVQEIASHYRAILEIIGENPDREGLSKTPLRAARALLDCTRGYSLNPQEVVGDAVFEHAGSKIIAVKDIEFYSFCEHHVLPFFGTVSIAYIPTDKMLGLSKLARIVDVYARRLQVQERLTSEICEAISKVMPNEGVYVKCRAQHLCMKMRGVEKQNSSTVTVEYSGLFSSDANLRREVEEMLRD